MQFRCNSACVTKSILLCLITVNHVLIMRDTPLQALITNSGPTLCLLLPETLELDDRERSWKQIHNLRMWKQLRQRLGETK